MKKFLGLILAFAVAFSSLPAFASGLTKYSIEVVDQNGKAVTSGATLRVKDSGTNTDSTIWPQDDNVTCDQDCGTLTGAVTLDSNGRATFWSTASTHDLIVHYRGKVYAYESFAPNQDRRIRVNKFDAEIDLDTDAVAVSSGVVTVPLKGNFFRVTGTSQLRTITSTGHQIGKEIKLLIADGLNIHTDGNIQVGAGKLVGSLQEVGAGSVVRATWSGSKWLIG